MSQETPSWQEMNLNPHELIVRTSIEQSGVLPDMIRRNPELSPRIIDFLIGQTRILVVGGESGMGKSLMVGDIRRLHQDIQPKLPPELLSQLCVLSWDRSHKAFFENMSTEAGESIPLPTGETHPMARTYISHVMADQVMFARKYIPQSRVLVEAPLIDSRGETLYDELPNAHDIQTFVMYSPRSRYETLREGRLMETSGQPDAMNEMRENLLKKILGISHVHISPDEQDDVIRKWWQERMRRWNGIVVEWDPDDNREGFNFSVDTFKQESIKPDVIAPRALSRFTGRQFRSVLDTIPDIDAFLRIISS